MAPSPVNNPLMGTAPKPPAGFPPLGAHGPAPAALPLSLVGWMRIRLLFLIHRLSLGPLNFNPTYNSDTTLLNFSILRQMPKTEKFKTLKGFAPQGNQLMRPPPQSGPLPSQGVGGPSFPTGGGLVGDWLGGRGVGDTVPKPQEPLSSSSFTAHRRADADADADANANDQTHLQSVKQTCKLMPMSMPMPMPISMLKLLMPIQPDANTQYRYRSLY
ncbi:hypothetical protein Tco_1256037 [Tanacetum coccineum]